MAGLRDRARLARPRPRGRLVPCSARGGSTSSATSSPAPASRCWRSRPSCSWGRLQSRWRGPPKPWRSPGWRCAAVTSGRRARRSSSAGWRSRTSSWSSIRCRRPASRPRSTFDPPLLNPEGGSLLAVLLALGITVGLVPVRWIRSVLAAVGGAPRRLCRDVLGDGSGPGRRTGADRADRTPAGPAASTGCPRRMGCSRSPAGRTSAGPPRPRPWWPA